MLDQTATTTTTTTTNDQTKYGCQTCGVSFESREDQRSHMREDWQYEASLQRTGEHPLTRDPSVYNLKRRIASLPSISRTVYNERVVAGDSGNESSDDASKSESWTAEKRDATRRTKQSRQQRSQRHPPKQRDDQAAAPSRSDPTAAEPEDDAQSAGEEDFNPLQCLFCNAEEASLDANLTHMGHDHGFFIPDAEYLFDVESFLGYLFILISQFHECLYCGTIRNSKFATQDHMRGKGHCKVDFENDEHDLSQFYDLDDETDEDGNRIGGKFRPVPDEDELHLPSGKTLGHRSRVQTSRRRRTDRGSPGEPSQKLLSHEEESKEDDNGEDSEPVPTLSNDRRLAMRAGTSTSMIGIPEVQQRALIATERQMLTVKSRQRNAYQSKVDKGGNQQKTFRVKSIGKKAGGLEKRLG